MRFMQRLSLVGVTLFILVNVIWFPKVSGIGAEIDEISAPFTIKLEKGLLSVSLQDTELKDVLEEISRQGGIGMIMEKPVEKIISMEFKDLPLEIGLRKLLEGTDYYIVFSSDKTGSSYTIKEVKIIPRSSGTKASRPNISRPSAPPTSPNPFVEALQSATKKGEGSKKLTPEQKKAIIEAFGKGSEENRKKAEELLKRLEEGAKEEEKKK
jgi:hypothetical protein